MRRNLPMLLIRVVVGLIFLAEGILEFLHPEELGVTFFSSIGLPSHNTWDLPWAALRSSAAQRFW